MLLWKDWDRVKSLFVQAREGEVRLMVSVVNWGEVIDTMAKRKRLKLMPLERHGE